MRAFPTDIYYDERRIGQHDGMELRDFFAVHALCGMLSPTCPWEPEDIAAWSDKAYEYADAMVRARKKRKAKA